MRIVQMLPVLAFGDAIGNDTLALDDALKKNGYEAAIYVEHLDERFKDVADEIGHYVNRKDDIIFFHLSTGADMNYGISMYDNPLIIMYHNITPGYFFEKYDETSMMVCDSGRRAAKYLKKKASLCFADSEFNKSELLEMGYECPIEVLPILIAFDDYKKKPTPQVISEYSDDGYTNIVFTGRVAPNKKHENLIAAFDYYKTYINPKSRLILVGRYDFFPEYYHRLEKYVKKLGVQDVIFTGQVKFTDILAYYEIADIFLCLSEHEGFCVPLVEAMMFDTPVIAYDSCAVGETLGGSGLLLPDKDPAVVAEAIERVRTDQTLRETIINNQRIRLKYFEHDRINAQFLKVMKDFTESMGLK